jgi:hypothetical protein
MASFSVLPVELTTAILNEVAAALTADVSPHEEDVSWHALCGLSRTCQSLRRLTLPLLYRSVVVFFGGFSMPWPRLRQTNRLVFLLQNLLEHPKRAAYMKTIALRVEGREITDTHFDVFAPRLFYTDHGDFLYQRALQDSSLPSDIVEQWMTCIRAGRIDALVALLLLVCTHLEVLSIDVNYLRPGSWVLWLIEYAGRHAMSAAQQPLPLDSVTTLSLSESLSGGNPLNPPEYLYPFYLRRLNRFHNSTASGFFFPALVGNHQPVWPLARTPGNAVALRELSIHHRADTHDFTLGLLKHAPNLVALELEIDLCTPQDEASWAVQGDLQLISQPFRDRLESLRIRYYSGNMGSLDPNAVIRYCRGALGGLHGLESLKSMEVPFAILFGAMDSPQTGFDLARVVPASVELLTINDDLWGFRSRWNSQSSPKRVASVLVQMLVGKRVAISEDRHESWPSGGLEWTAALPKLKHFGLRLAQQRDDANRQWSEVIRDGVLELLEQHCETRFSYSVCIEPGTQTERDRCLSDRQLLYERWV